MDIIKRVTKFDKPTCRALSADVVAELEGFAASRGLTVRFAGGSVGEMSATLKLEFGLEGVDRRAEDFKRHAASYGLKATDLDREFTIGAQRFTVVGLDTRKRARPIVIRRHGDDTLRICDVESVRRALADS